MTANIKRDRSFGFIPVYGRGRNRRYLLVQHRGGHWGFPKGHPKGEEQPLATARRELEEETGLDDPQIIEEPTFTEEYRFRRRGRLVDKKVTYFLGLVDRQDVTVPADELRGHAWLEVSDAYHRLTFGQGRRILEAAEAFLCEQGDAVPAVDTAFPKSSHAPDTE